MPRRITGPLVFFALVAAALLAAALVATTAGSAWAAGGTDPARFRLTPALLERMEAATAEVRKLPQAPAKADADDGDDEDESEAESVDDIARKLDADPRVRAALARHGLSSREYATAVLAALHAGMALATEKAAAPGTARNFTPEQRANVEVMREHQSRKKRR
ncbi:hypothetical protein [Piscinibacter sp.]|uniref:hypothetical protein n=1 Tax=Piscinibacter sp. TaxID=1903157 RepID=UPI0039E5A675